MKKSNLHCLLFAGSQFMHTGLSFSLLTYGDEFTLLFPTVFYLAQLMGIAAAVKLGEFAQHSPRKTRTIYTLLALALAGFPVLPFVPALAHNIITLPGMLGKH